MSDKKYELFNQVVNSPTAMNFVGDTANNITQIAMTAVMKLAEERGENKAKEYEEKAKVCITALEEQTKQYMGDLLKIKHLSELDHEETMKLLDDFSANNAFLREQVARNPENMEKYMEAYNKLMEEYEKESNKCEEKTEKRWNFFDNKKQRGKWNGKFLRKE